MSFLNLNFDDTYEYKSLAEGEYQVRVLNAEIKTSQKTGGDFIQVTLEAVGEPEAKNINHVFMLPTANDDKKKANNRLLAIKNFLTAMGIDPGKGFDVAELQGCSGWAILVEETDPEYGTQNRVRRFITSK